MNLSTRSKSEFAPAPSTTTPSSDTPLAQQVVRGGLFVALASYGTIAFGFVANLFLTRLLTPEDFGVFSLATFFFTLINIRPKLGLDAAFAQRFESDPAWQSTYLFTSVAAGLASSLLALLFIPILIVLGYPSIITWIVAALGVVGVADSLMLVGWTLLEKQLLFRTSSLVTLISFPLSYASAFYLALQGAGPWSLVAQSLTYSSLLLVGTWIACTRSLPEMRQWSWTFSRILARKMIRFGSVVGLTAVAGTLLFQFDNFLVGTFVSIAALGFYDRAYRIAQWPYLLVSSVLARTAFYAYVRLQNDTVRLAKTVSMTIWLVTRLAIPLALAIFIVAPDLIVLLWGERWVTSAFYLRLLLAFSVLRPLLDDAGSLFVATGRPLRQTSTILIQAAALIGFATPLTMVWGVVGTTIGVGIAFAVGLMVTYYLVKRTVTFSLKSAFLAPAFALVATLALYFISTRMFDWNSLVLIARVALKIAFGSAVYSSLVFVIEPGLSLERGRYVWKLLTARNL